MSGVKWTAFAASVVVHILFLGLLGLSLSVRPATPPPKPAGAPKAVQAVAVNEQLVRAEMERLQSEQEQARQSDLAQKKRMAEEAERARKARQQEEKRLAALKLKAAEEEARRKQVEAVETQRLARLEKERKQLEEQQAAERQRLAELEKQRKMAAEEAKRAEEERKRKEAEAKRLAEVERKRQEAEQALKAQLAAEERRLAAERQGQLHELKSQYVALIRDKIQRNWLRPAGTPEEFSCKLTVHQILGGEVVNVHFQRSCGNAALDRSVENAVRKASPLPAPPDPELFEREIDLTFVPR